MKGLLSTIFVCSFLLCFSQSTTSPLWCDLVPGKYDVGLKVEYLIDTTRTMMSTDSLPHALNGKPIRVKLYYPGIKSSSSYQLSFLDQIDIFPVNHQLATYNAILNTRDRRLQGQFSPASDSLERVLFDLQTMAFMDIDHAEGKFPLLIYLLGLDDHQMENSVLWEYLASQGYVVAVLPSFGISLERIDVPYRPEGITTVYDDAMFVLNTFKSKPYVDGQKIGAVGHSFGGLVINYLAAKHQNIKALVSLDGSFNLERGVKLIDSTGLNISNIRSPLLNLYVKSPSRNLSYVDSLSSPVYNVGFHKATHYDFQNFGLYAFVTNSSDPRVERRRSAAEAKDILISSIRLTKYFLDYTLNGIAQGEQFAKGISQEAKSIVEIADFSTKNVVK